MSGRSDDRNEIASALGEAYDEERVAATWQRIVQSRAAKTGRARPVVAAAAVAVAAAAAVAVVVVGVGRGGGAGAPRGDDGEAARSAEVVRPGPLVGANEAVGDVAVGAVVEAAEAREIVLDDGSKVVLEKEARLQVLANDGAQFVTILDRGPARFEVTPGGPRRWTIETALATVEVVGTKFVVAPEAERLVVEVERGVVVVRGGRVPGRVVRLGAGERIVVEEARGRKDAREVAPRPMPAPAQAEKPPTPTPTPTPTIREPVGVSDALKEADRLRAAGDVAAAIEVLEKAILEEPEAEAVGIAAFTVGRLALELGQNERAARAFQRVIDAGSPTSLVEDAHARKVEALIKAGRRAEAARALAAYQKAFPEARRVPTLREKIDAMP